MAKRERKALLGRKVGMSQLYTEGGARVPVTLIEAGPCTVLQVKTVETDGYEALQIGFSDTAKRVTKPMEGVFKKVGTAAKRCIREIPKTTEAAPGDTIDLSIFEGIAKVDISGVSKGRGFSGSVRRWNHAIGPKSHGSKSKRVLGSLGMHQDPGRIIKGQSMPGQYGNKNVKTRNLQVVSFDVEKNLLVVRGAVPGPKGGFLYIEESIV
ncbi:MAG: 50S ribosomal protein L3 [Planctomycetes bacterium]|nr:50S ribosomal protein L3 [Planctomycetota bacterium]